jgi:hypothetical protein
MNPNANLFMTVLAAQNAAQDVLKFENTFLERIYWDHRPQVAQPYETLRIVVPTLNEGNVVDIGLGPLQPTDYSYLTADVKLKHNFADTYVVKEWDAVRTSIDLQTKFFAPRFEEMLRAMNRSAIALMIASNFSTSGTPPSYTLFTGTGTVPNQITRADLATAWTNLANAGVPMGNADVSLIVNPFTFGQFLADNNFTQALYVGDAAAVAAQQRAMLAPMLGVVPYYDQMLAAFNAGKAPAVMMHKYAIAGVTARLGTNTARPGVYETVVYLKGVIPCRIQIAYSLTDQGDIVNFGCLCGFAVVRPDMASLFQSAS